MLTVNAMMQKTILTAAKDESVARAAERMTEAGVGAVLLVDGDRVDGIFTERDLLKVVGKGVDPATAMLGDVATRNVVTVDAGTRLRACAELLREHGIRHVPVVEAGRPIGILSSRDFFESAAQGLERFIERAKVDEALREDDPYDHLGGSYGR